MRSFRFETVDVFTDRRFGGNPLAVFPDAGGLSDAEMQALAAEFNLSETSFVLPPSNPSHTARVRIFTRQRELPFAGHPNVGTAYVLAKADPHAERLVFEEAAGLVEVRLLRDAGRVTGAAIDAPLPLETAPAPSIDALAACAGLDPADFTAARAVTASVGIPFILAEVADAALIRAAPDEAAFRRLRLAGDQPYLHLYARPSGGAVRARMFAPLSGTHEDPATGSANAALAAFLLSVTDRDSHELTVSQGTEMGRPSLIRATATRRPDGIRAGVGGGCVPVLRGEAIL